MTESRHALPYRARIELSAGRVIATEGKYCRISRTFINKSLKISLLRTRTYIRIYTYTFIIRWRAIISFCINIDFDKLQNWSRVNARICDTFWKSISIIEIFFKIKWLQWSRIDPSLVDSSCPSTVQACGVVLDCFYNLYILICLL